MDLKTTSIENAVKAAKELGLNSIPWAWIKFIQSGWEIRPTPCDCGGNWAWLKPRPSGAMDVYGCVCHNEVNLSRLLDTKQHSSSLIIKSLLQNEKPKKEDIGKIFFVSLESLADGTIISREDFVKLDPVEVGWWIEIDDFDIK